MKTLTTTAIATALALFLGAVVMLLLKNPLGGQPYTVITIKERKQAEDQLQKEIRQSAQLKSNARKEKITPQQKNPVYFQKDDAADDDDQLDEHPLFDDDDEDDIHPKGLSEKAKKQAKAEIEKQLEYIARIGLPPAPRADLIEKTKYGELPRISDNGHRPLEVYKRPAPKAGKERKTIAILVSGLGLSQPLTENALEKLPPEITLSFNPYAVQLKNWARRSRKNGHELMLELPMEPFDYPDNDPGPHTLLTFQSDNVNIERLNWLMGRMPGYVGVLNLDGSKFTSDEGAIYSIMREIKNRGLLYMDANPEQPVASEKVSQEIKLEYLNSSLIIDQNQNRTSIDDALKRLEQTANSYGRAIGLASASPLSIQRISEWAESLKERGITLIPLSAALPDKQS